MIWNRPHITRCASAGSRAAQAARSAAATGTAEEQRPNYAVDLATVQVAVGYGEDLDRVRRLMLETAREVLADPGLDREGIALTFSSADKRVRPRTKLDNDF